MQLKRWNSEYFSHKTIDDIESHLIYRLGNRLQSWIASTEKSIEIERGDREVVRLEVEGGFLWLHPDWDSMFKQIKETSVLDSDESVAFYEVEGKRIFHTQNLPAYYLPEWVFGRVVMVGIVNNEFQTKEE